MTSTEASDYKYLDKSVKMSEKNEQQYKIQFKCKRYMTLYMQYLIFIVDYNGKLCDMLYVWCVNPFPISMKDEQREMCDAP